MNSISCAQITAFRMMWFRNSNEVGNNFQCRIITAILARPWWLAPLTSTCMYWPLNHQYGLHTNDREDSGPRVCWGRNKGHCARWRAQFIYIKAAYVVKVPCILVLHPQNMPSAQPAVKHKAFVGGPLLLFACFRQLMPKEVSAARD